MATPPDLSRSWARTEAYLRDARAHLSQIAEAEFADGLAHFEEYLEHNELGLAFDTLDSVANESIWENHRVIELLAIAAASMGLTTDVHRLDAKLSELKGWAYQTVLPPDST